MKLVGMICLSTVMLFGMVDINTADIKELTSLKGIGKGKASKIIEYRKINGCFKDIMELTKVKGIAKGLVKKNHSQIEISSCQ